MIIRQENEITNSSSERLLWIDVLKILAAFLVVLQHSISAEWIDALDYANTFTWYGINLAFELSKIGVPIFFMCSGAVMLRKERSIHKIYQHNIMSVIKVYICWMLIYGIRECMSMITNGNVSIRTLANAMIKSVLFGQYHTWFIPTILGLYMITPILYVIVQHRTLGKYFLCLAIVFTIFIPFVEKLDRSGRVADTFSDFNMQFCVGYSLYYVLGYYIAAMSRGRKMDIIAFLVSICLAFLISNQRALAGAYGDTQNVYTEFSVLGFLICVSLFSFFVRTGDKWSRVPEMTKNIIRTLSRYGIAIYLMHPLFLPIIDNWTGLSCIPGALIIWIVVVVVVRFIDFLPVRRYFLGR